MKGIIGYRFLTFEQKKAICRDALPLAERVWVDELKVKNLHRTPSKVSVEEVMNSLKEQDQFALTYRDDPGIGKYGEISFNTMRPGVTNLFLWIHVPERVLDDICEKYKI